MGGKMAFGPIEAQWTTVRLLSVLNSGQIVSIIQSIENDLPDAESLNYLNLCILASRELKKHPDYLNDIRIVLKTIVAIQLGKTPNEVKQNQFLKPLGLKYGYQLNRIELGTKKISIESIQSLCNGFRDRTEARFWTNQVARLIPDIRLCVDNHIEETCLQRLWNYLDPNIRNKAADELHLNAWQIEELQTGQRLKDNQGNSSLYDVIDAAKRRAGYSNEKLINAIGVNRDTWYLWRTEWIRAEHDCFAHGFPSRRLSRTHLYLIALILDMDYLDTVHMLALAGCYIKSTQPDITVIRCLLSSESDRQDTIQYLYQFL